jgi:hypothetical protein
MSLDYGEIALIEYNGNSVGYIYEKMRCYREQVSTMADLLKMVGIDYANIGDTNDERRKRGLELAENIREQLGYGPKDD